MWWESRQVQVYLCPCGSWWQMNPYFFQNTTKSIWIRNVTIKINGPGPSSIRRRIASKDALTSNLRNWTNLVAISLHIVKSEKNKIQLMCFSAKYFIIQVQMQLYSEKQIILETHFTTQLHLLFWHAMNSRPVSANLSATINLGLNTNYSNYITW